MVVSFIRIYFERAKVKYNLLTPTCYFYITLLKKIFITLVLLIIFYTFYKKKEYIEPVIP
jgi:hypothetical protein